MSANVISTLATDDMLRRCAMARWRVADASVSSYAERFSYGEPQPATWYVLAIREQPGDEWRVVCRRRTRGEIMELIEVRDQPWPTTTEHLTPKEAQG